jgi:hypothetical protein
MNGNLHSHCHHDVNSFPFQFLIFSRIFIVARYRAHSKKTQLYSERASHCHDDVNSFPFQFLIFSRIFLDARYRAPPRKRSKKPV